MMRRARSWIAAAAALSAFLLLPTAAEGTVGPSTMVQVGTYDSLIQPDYTGLARLDQVLTDQTIGLGTFADLDGELVLVGGVVYQVRPDGLPRAVDRSVTTPFMQAIKFRAQVNAPIPPGTACANLVTIIDTAIKSTSGVVAVRVRGTFTDLVTRSVTADPPPFQPLAATVAEQTIFALGTTRAVLVGFRQGSDALGLGQPGLHLHAVTNDRRSGGHVLSCIAGPDVQLSLQRVDEVRVGVGRNLPDVARG